MKILLLVIDGFGLGAFPDAINVSVEIYGKIISNAKLPTFSKLGLSSINNLKSKSHSIASYGYLKAMSAGTDITSLYFELSGLHIKNIYPTYKKGLPEDLFTELEKELGTNIIGNIVADGSRVINDLGALHYNTGFPIIYTSKSSVMYIAAHEDIMPIEKLYTICKKVRKIMTGKHNIARVIASPFNGKINGFYFTDNNMSFTTTPPAPTMLDVLNTRGIEVISIGNINQIFSGQGITRSIPSRSNEVSFKAISDVMKSDTNGFIFASIEAADTTRDDDVRAYTRCVEDIDSQINNIIKLMDTDDLLIITSNHSYESSNDLELKDGYLIPMLIYGGRIKPNINLGTLEGLYSVSHTILDYYGINGMKKSFLSEVLK